MLQLGGATALEAIKILLNKCPPARKISGCWENAEVILLHKKGDNSKFKIISS